MLRARCRTDREDASESLDRASEPIVDCARSRRESARGPWHQAIGLAQSSQRIRDSLSQIRCSQRAQLMITPFDRLNVELVQNAAEFLYQTW